MGPVVSVELPSYFAPAASVTCVMSLVQIRFNGQTNRGKITVNLCHVLFLLTVKNMAAN